MAPESSNLSAPTMAKYKGEGSLLFWSDLKGEWIKVEEPKKEYDLKLNISADTGELMESLKAATESIKELGDSWQAVSGSVGTSGIKYWGKNEPVYTSTYPFDYDPVYKPIKGKQVSVATPAVEVDFDPALHTLTFHVQVSLSESELDEYNGCTTRLGEVIGDMMKKQVVGLLLERNKELKEKGA